MSRAQRQRRQRIQAAATGDPQIADDRNRQFAELLKFIACLLAA
jgi:hypothetical protein